MSSNNRTSLEPGHRSRDGIVEVTGGDLVLSGGSIPHDVADEHISDRFISDDGSSPNLPVTLGVRMTGVQRDSECVIMGLIP